MLIEQKFMDYLLGDPKFSGINNGRSNVQPNFYKREVYEKDIFPTIWNELHELDIVSSEEVVKNSTLFANSPFKSLSNAQLEAKEQIIMSIDKKLKSKSNDAVILKITGVAGTGKTILLSNIFWDLFKNEHLVQENGMQHDSSVALLVRHEQQLRTYKQIANKLNMRETVFDVPGFISNKKEYDVVLVDEAHLLWTGNYGRVKKDKWQPDLEAIKRLAKVVVLIYDPNQVVSSKSYLPERVKEELNDAEGVQLKQQWRIQASEETRKYIINLAQFSHNSIVHPPFDENYEIKIFNSASDMFSKIKQSDNEFGLSRLVATYDWPYSQGNHPKNESKYWMVKTKDGLQLPWNLQLPEVKQAQKAGNPWQSIPSSLYEVGSNYTVQGADLNYVGVILGPSIIYDEKNNSLEIDISKSKDSSAHIKPKSAIEWTEKDIEKNLKNIVNVLMTRGVKGLYIYADDDNLREKLKKLDLRV
ncbi:DNA/RNA helicase domain-containing protein [Weissella halotolerans]|uniref:DNA/RNA helicase domain-containing protein n=1 Tax=Weissella halotolerans TaxID=1615 RepID=UPI0012EAA2A0|nr:DNA/RNA helicase domain-containing protein [Weissella halotolerans]